jgi:SAM-dependent methyltransferase
LARGTLLNVGCGAQPYRWLLPEGVKYIGMDIVDAKERCGYTQPDTLYYSGNVWPIESRSVDFVLSTETLEHVIEPASFLAEAYRCLRPGGRLLLTVPFAARPAGIALRVLRCLGLDGGYFRERALLLESNLMMIGEKKDRETFTYFR